MFRLDLTAAALIAFDTVGSDFDAVLRIADAGSCPGTELACDDDSSDDDAGQAELTVALEAGAYWVIVDGKNVDSAGRFVLNARLEPIGPTPPNDGCSGALAISPGTTPRTTIGTTNGAGNHLGSCAIAPGPDVWYTFTLAQRTLVYLDLLDGGAWDAVLNLREGSCRIPVSVACEDDACGTLRPRFLGWLEPGTYYVLVDGRSPADFGTFSLRYQGLQAVDDCVTDALPLTADGRTTGATTGGTSHVTSSCATGLGSPDDLYYFAGCPGADFTASTCDAATDFDTALSLWRRGCDTMVACNDDGPTMCREGVGPDASTLNTTLLPEPQIYLLAVDGARWTASSGSYGLTVSGL